MPNLISYPIAVHEKFSGLSLCYIRVTVCNAREERGIAPWAEVIYCLCYKRSPNVYYQP